MINPNNERDPKIALGFSVIYFSITLLAAGTSLAAFIIPPFPKNSSPLGADSALSLDTNSSSSSGSNPGDVQGYALPMFTNLFTTMITLFQAITMFEHARQEQPAQEERRRTRSVLHFLFTIPIPFVLAMINLEKKNDVIPDSLKTILLLTASANLALAGVRLLEYAAFFRCKPNPLAEQVLERRLLLRA